MAQGSLSLLIPMQLGERANISSSIVRSVANMLTGAELLTKVKERGDVSKSDLVRSAGYVSTKKDGTERLNFTAFYEVLLEAKGVSFGDGGGSGGKGRPGRSLRWAAWRRVCRYSATTALTCAWSMASASAMAKWHRCRAPASPIASDRGRGGAERSATSGAIAGSARRAARGASAAGVVELQVSR
jgi:hypothetical protein